MSKAVHTVLIYDTTWNRNVLQHVCCEAWSRCSLMHAPTPKCVISKAVHTVVNYETKWNRKVLQYGFCEAWSRCSLMHALTP